MTAQGRPPERPVQEPDRAPLRAIAVATGVSLAVILACVVCAAFVNGSLVASRALPQAIPSAGGPARVGRVYQTLIPSPTTGDALDRARGRLAGYGWVDRANGIVRIPIERAMQLRAQAAP